MDRIKFDPRMASGLLLSLFLLFGAASAFAHPMGNFSVNHYGKIKIGQKSVEILYLIDMAEIPTYQEMRKCGMAAEPESAAALHYLKEQDAQLRQGLNVASDGQLVALSSKSHQLIFAEGAGGLPTMKLAFVFEGRLGAAAGEHKLSYADNNFPGRAGWKEIVIAIDGAALLQADAPETDRSQELTNYSSDLLNSPPQQLSAAVSFRTLVAPIESVPSRIITPLNSITSDQYSHVRSVAQVQSRAASTSITPLPKVLQSSQPAVSSSESSVQRQPLQSQNTPRSRFTELISTQNKLSFWVLFSAAFIAAGLGALHALEPGHGKTIVAAYLVGSRGTPRHAVLLGFVVTAAHTAGVYLLGLVTLYASRYIVPEQLYPWLGAISGLSVIALGGFIFLRNLTGESGEHSHAFGERHSHGFLSVFKSKPVQKNEAVGHSPEQVENQTVSLRELCILGITGGIVPCPAALVVLLSAFSLHRIGFGLFLITAFSLGLAAVLVIIGLSMVYTKQLMGPRLAAKSSAMRYLPLLSSGFMVLLGVGIAGSALSSAHIGQSLFSKDKLLPFVTVTLLGLFLGMRHSTDPDHVVAVSTIVSRQKSMKSSAAIGLLWGLGHTLTIFLVGSAIIIFGVVIPPRLGLSMEFSVALMLILLGILNLTGVMSWITERFTPEKSAAAPLSVDASSNAASASSEDEITRSRNGKPSFGSAFSKLGLYQTLRPLVIGLVHGLAGSAAVALLVLSTIKNPFWATAYLLVFGGGTMVGMMLMTTAISAPLVYAGQKFFNVNRHLTTISGLASVAFGMFLVYQIGFVDGLFSSHVHWVPQ
jgi:ABC-type nickel/cobalt efflux system permease component RcnA